MAEIAISTGVFYSDITSVLQLNKNATEASDNEYDTLLRVLADPGTQAEVIVQCLQDLEQCISVMTKEHKTLVRIIMNLDWLDKGPVLISVYQAFMLNLVSAQMAYFKPCLRMLVKKFVPDPRQTVLYADPEVGKQKKEEDFAHIHALLKSMSQLIPVTSVLIVPVMEDMFPYLNKGMSHFESYCRSVLAVSTYLPALRKDIIELVIKQMLKLDVRSSRLDISTVISTAEEENEDPMEDSMDTIFKMEDAKELKSDFKLEPDTKEMKPEPPKPSLVGERLASELPMAGSLDAMMTLVLQYIHDVCHVGGLLEWTLTKTVYREFLSAFDKYIFPTHTTCHVQFVMFYICSFKEALSDGFLDYLWKKVTDPTAESIYRQTAACYIGSFLTRALYISTNTGKDVMELMVKWVHKYLDQTSDHQQKADLSHHGPFYSVCQSIFYIFCFKHNDFLQMKNGHKWAESLNFQRIVTSKLNPLRVCIPIIVKTFASATRMHQLAFCDTIIERNNRYSLPVASISYAWDKSGQQLLESYFPFDPYLLPKSSSHLIPIYREYHGSLPEEEESDDEDEDDFLPEEDDTQQLTDSISMSLGKSPVDFLHYGTSPGFKHA